MRDYFEDFVLFVQHFYYTLKLVSHVLVALLIILLAGAGLFAIAEGIGYGRALYFAAITGLTVGYGDIVPTTVLGRILSVLIGLVGLIFFGIVVAAATRALSHLVEDRRRERRVEKRSEST